MTQQQFATFDNLEDRREIFKLLKRLGDGVSEEMGNVRRAGFLQGLIVGSTSGFAQAPMTVDSCSAIEAYNLFIAITGVLGVPIESATRTLEQVVRVLTGGKNDDRRASLCGS